jgi:molecular chaperone HtpG
MKGKVVYFEELSSDEALIAQLLAEGIQAISTETYIDPHFTQHVEMQKKNDVEIKFQLVDNAIEDLLETHNATEDDVKIKDLFQTILVGEKDEKNPSQLEIEVKNFKNSATAAYFKVDESMKRFQQMTKSMGQSNFDMPSKKTLVLNPSHNLVKNAFKLSENTEKKELAGRICHHIQDLAAISGEGLNDKQRKDFVSRSQDLISELSNLAL